MKMQEMFIPTKIENKKKVQMATGSITVEASFVMPIVIVTVFALIYLAFYLHDICRIQGIVDLAIHKAGMSVKHDTDIKTGEIAYEKINERGVFYLLSGNTEEEERVTNLLKLELSKGLFLIRADKVEVKTDKLNIYVSIKTATGLTLPGLTHIFRAFPDKVVTGEYPVHNPAEAVRCIEVILDTGSKVKGIEELKKSIDKISKSIE